MNKLVAVTVIVVCLTATSLALSLGIGVGFYCGSEVERCRAETAEAQRKEKQALESMRFFQTDLEKADKKIEEYRMKEIEDLARPGKQPPKPGS